MIREGFGFFDKLFNRLVCWMMVIPVDSCVGREADNAGFYRQALAKVLTTGDRVADHDDTVKGDAIGTLFAFTGSNADCSCCSCAAIAFPNQILRRKTAVVLPAPELNEVQQCFGILLNAKEVFLFILVQQYAITGANRINQNEIGNVQQAVRIVDDFPGTECGRTVGLTIADSAYTQETSMDIHGRTARAAIVAKDHRSGAGIFDIRTKIGIRENRCDGFSFRIIEDIVFRYSLVRNLLAIEFNGTFGSEAGWLEIILLHAFSLIQHILPLFYGLHYSKAGNRMEKIRFSS